MRPLNRATFVVLGLCLLAAALFVGGVAAATGPLRVEITIHYSHYSPAAISVPTGREVTFVIHNDDPIDHEWILGDAAVQQLHRIGADQIHNRPTELSIPALTTVTTTLRFDQPTSLQYICHLPGHEAYGMVGVLTVK